MESFMASGSIFVFEESRWLHADLNYSYALLKACNGKRYGSTLSAYFVNEIFKNNYLPLPSCNHVPPHESYRSIIIIFPN